MHYIIDANNLAGVLGILNDDNFDYQLFHKIKKFVGNKNILVDLVFDSSDYYGDWKQFGNINIFYAPKDMQYSCADDKIVSLVKKNVNKNDKTIVVTNDIDLQNRINSIIRNFGRNFLGIEKSSVFALNLFKKYNTNVDDVEKHKLSNNDIQEINQEIMEIYGGIS